MTVAICLRTGTRCLPSTFGQPWHWCGECRKSTRGDDRHAILDTDDHAAIAQAIRDYRYPACEWCYVNRPTTWATRPWTCAVCALALRGAVSVPDGEAGQLTLVT